MPNSGAKNGRIAPEKQNGNAKNATKTESKLSTSCCVDVTLDLTCSH